MSTPLATLPEVSESGERVLANTLIGRLSWFCGSLCCVLGVYADVSEGIYIILWYVTECVGVRGNIMAVCERKREKVCILVKVCVFVNVNARVR